MRFVALEFFKWRQIRIGVGEPHDEADRDQIIFHVIQERAAVGVGFERPTGRMHDQARRVFAGCHFP